MKQTISIIGIILIITFIWSNSYQDGTNSIKSSMFFTSNIQPLLIKLGFHPNLIIMDSYIRKMAHLTEFMALGAVIYYTFKQLFNTAVSISSCISTKLCIINGLIIDCISININSQFAIFLAFILRPYLLIIFLFPV